MSLKREIALILLVVISLFTVLVYAVQRFVIYPSYRELDRVEARGDLQRGLVALQREILHLDKLLHNWSAWDDSLRFLRVPDAAYIESNLGPTTFLDNHLNVIFFLDLEGRVIWGRACTLDDLTNLTLAELPADTFPPGSPLLNHRMAADSVTGILLTAAGPMLIASRPIVDSGKTAPPAGTLLMGRLLERDELEAITAQTGVELAIWSCIGCGGGEERSALSCGDHDCGWLGGAAPPVEDLRAIRRIDGENSLVLREEGEGRLSAYALLPDVTGAGFLVLKSSSSMPISAAGRDVLRGAMLSLLCVGLLILVVLLEALKFSVLKPLALLTSHAEALRRNESHDGLISSILRSRNEIGVLAREFDSMVAQLALVRRQLAEQSYHSGMTEMAAGVIHNLRNALTPITANLDLLKEEFRGLPVRQMESAAIELDAGAPVEERRKMLSRYLCESLTYLVETMTDMQGRLRILDMGVTQVEKILSDQEKFVAVRREGEGIDLVSLVREAVVLLNLDYFNGLELRIDRSLEETGVVQGHRNALLQVFTNLLGNAHEAIFQGNRRDGRIEIRVVPEPTREPEMMHVVVSDNGCGISAADLPHLFERGYTTKINAGSGRGLHWCANAIAAMHGRLWAESEGPGQGSALHVLLPKRLPKEKGKR